ncbi:hypothetical protein Vadar_015012 [Vaccinium darrowii]|uniref:Uncharacterized protein n=1 Tax=Vaccinium darrowii TaxID=229202 RepID=A0ACB7XHY7_9ERIC|nr:hypothetical protein Vadar_015012 [Vaccinium darrowii]
MKMEESIAVSAIMDKLSSTWKDYKKSLKHKKEDLSVEEWGNHLRIEDEFRARDNTEEHDSQSSKVHVVEEGQSSRQASNLEMAALDLLLIKGANLLASSSIIFDITMVSSLENLIPILMPIAVDE